MKAVIENPLTFLVNSRRNKEMLCSFNSILEAITTSDTVEELKENVLKVIPYYNIKYFDVGFGSNHMWVHQSKQEGNASVNTEKRILFVEF